MPLLDTQAVLWLMAGDRRLGDNASRIIRSGPAHYSAVSIFEIRIKSMLGKLAVGADFPNRLRSIGLIELPITSEHAEAVRGFPQLIRHDPFDRLLVAQSAVAGIDLLTADRVLLGLGRDHIVDATV